jgi:alkyldihydroxyacetonephosphate synthase
MRWWGWGRDDEASPLSAGAERLLSATLGASRHTAPVALEQVRLPSSALDQPARTALEDAVGAEAVATDRLARVSHARGKSYPDLVRLRHGDATSAPDAVCYPSSAAEVEAVLAACAGHELAVVAFGGGTSVVGGVEPSAGRHRGAVSLDLARMTEVTLDRRSRTATVGPGLTGPDLEAALGAQGLTLGHFPQSFAYSTVGGWVATRSAGQASTGYGRIDERVQSVAAATPAGALEAGAVPASAAGPDLCRLFVGSEGVLGVLTQAVLAVDPSPATCRYEAWSFPSFAAGCEALRQLGQNGPAPHVARLSDPTETRFTLAAGKGAVADRAARGYLRLRGQAQPCLTILGWEGEPGEVARRRRAGAKVARAHGAVPLGTGPGQSWVEGRFRGPYQRDALLDRGVLVDTLETAASWQDLAGVYAAVCAALGSALADRGTPGMVGCHVSHLYPTGASLYFTYFARQQPGAELAQWRAAKHAATDALLSAGGTLTHHHGVGADHAPWMPTEVGELGLEALRAVKERLDPAGIMNPGKLTTG